MSSILTWGSKNFSELSGVWSSFFFNYKLQSNQVKRTTIDSNDEIIVYNLLTESEVIMGKSP